MPKANQIPPASGSGCAVFEGFGIKNQSDSSTWDQNFHIGGVLGPSGIGFRSRAALSTWCKRFYRGLGFGFTA